MQRQRERDVVGPGTVAYARGLLPYTVHRTISEDLIIRTLETNQAHSMGGRARYSAAVSGLLYE